MRATRPQPTPDARKLLEAGRLDQAVERAAEEATADPDNPEPLYVRAVAERYLGRIEAAFATLGRLKALEPRYARAWQEEGHLHKLRGDIDAACAAYRRAVELNRGLVASWRELAALEQRRGNAEAHALAAITKICVSK